jgi:hypothetical protein
MSGSKPSLLQGYVDRLFRIDSNAQKQNESAPLEHGIQLSEFVASAKKPPRAYLPPKEWFDPKVQALTFADVFTLWPPAELDLLKLILGRVCVGRAGNIHVNSDLAIEHTFRSIGIVVGEDAGLGKSTIFEKTFRAMNLVGYRRSNFRKVGERFGLGEVVTSDVAYKDDLTASTLQDLISSENAKVIASGGQILVEDKFAKGFSVASRTVLLANTNVFNPRLAFSLDPGSVDRTKLLSTYRRNELDRMAAQYASESASDSPNFAPFVHLPWLANKLEVSEEALMLWALRLAADDFIQHCFYRGEVPTESLRFRVHELTTRLRLSFNKDCTRAVMSAMALSHCLLSHLPNSYRGRKPYEIRELNQAILVESFKSFRILVCDKNLYRLRQLIKMHWEANGRSETHPWAGIRKLNFTSIKSAQAALDVCVASNSPLDEIVKATFGSLTLRDGFALSSDIVWAISAWQANSGCSTDLDAFARVLNRLIAENSNKGQQLDGMIEVLSQGSVDDKWLDSTEYTPKAVESQLTEHSRGMDESFFTEDIALAKWHN